MRSSRLTLAFASCLPVSCKVKGVVWLLERQIDAEEAKKWEGNAWKQDAARNALELTSKKVECFEEEEIKMKKVLEE